MCWARRASWLAAGLLSFALAGCSSSGGDEPSAACDPACDANACLVCDESGEWDYKRTCVEGPVFAAEKIVW